MDHSDRLSAGPFKIPCMSWLDVIDGANELLPRKWKRYIVLLVACVFALSPPIRDRAVDWYVTQRTQQFTDTFDDFLKPLPSPTVEPRSPSGAPDDAKANHRKHETPR